MFAKLYIYQSEIDLVSDDSVPVTVQMNKSIADLSSARLADWELRVNNLTTGDLIDLLLCVDALGFLEVSTID